MTNDTPEVKFHRAGLDMQQGDLWFKYLRFMRVMQVPRKQGREMSGPPMTLVCAEKWYEHYRLIYFVDLRSRWWIDGWHWSRLRRRYRDATIVNAQTLTPFHPDYRRPPRQSRQDKKFFRKWRTYYRDKWIVQLKAESVSELWPANWWERLVERFTTPRLSRHLQLLSEERIKWFEGAPDCYGVQHPPCRYSYAHETTVLVDHPTLYKDSLGGAKEVIGYAVIVPHVQADCKQFAVRCWYIDHAAGDRKHYDGWDMPVRTDDAVSLLHVRAGLESPSFDPTDLRDTTDRPRVMNHCNQSKQDWLDRIAKKNAKKQP